MLYKHVLFKDLQDYLKRTDYFSGYTPTEKAWIKENLELVGKKEVQLMVDSNVAGVKSGSYQEITNLINNKELQAGFIYIIKDFQTIYQAYNGQTWGKELNPSKKYDLITMAYSPSKLINNVIVISDNPKSLLWNVKYDFTPKTLFDGTTTQGEIIYLEDENGNKANYDFKNIKWKYGYTFDLDGKENSNQCYGNDLMFTKNVVIKQPVNYLINKYSNILISSDLNLTDYSIKQVIKYNNTYYLDYLDLETLTHQFYAIDTVL